MKKIMTLMAMAAIFTACSNEETESPLNVYSLTGYADTESRTAFGIPDANKIPFAWSANDYIYAGSTKSNVITSGGNSATFTFASTPSATEVYYNIAGSSAKQANVKAEQTIGNLGANGDFGYGTISNGSFTLNHATAYLWFDIETLPQGATLESITFDAGESSIAGTATWDGSSFGTISNGSNSIRLDVNKTAVSGAETSMVVFPVAVEKASVTYQLSVGGTTKYYQQTLGEKTFLAGTTYRIDVNLATADLYELRVLTFEDEDAKFGPLECKVWDNSLYSYAEQTINKWSDYIPTDEQYGGGHGRYEWYDKNNTELAYKIDEDALFQGYGGHAGISNYVGSDWENIGLGYYPSDLQAYNVTGGHSGTNFNTHFGYLDESGYGMMTELVYFEFGDGISRVIDHMWVTNTTYVYNQLQSCTQFGANYTLSDTSKLKIVAYGYESEDDTTPIEAEFYLLNTGKQIITEWTKWDLSVLGKVVKVEFNLVGSDDMVGSYGLVVHAYFAYDDVAVQFEE